ncbi:MAG: hypothetical protein U9Q16_00925 [Patescibacteria group bacterium]|nr:hypothetical protein [candidate division Zixibacteria bacterium]MEA3344231.1 hypothetical protein [Patescibacteria group bacterium]
MEQPNTFAAFIPLIIMIIPLIILNIFIAIRKGKNSVLFGILSLLPLVGFYIAIYLSSLTDKSIDEKIDKILNLIEQR